MKTDDVKLSGWESPARYDAFVKERGTGFIFKHSTRCSVSDWAHGEVLQFSKKNPAVPVYLVLVVENRATSRHVADELNIPHASPQVILLRRGEAAWTATHDGVSAAAMQEAWDNDAGD